MEDAMKLTIVKSGPASKVTRDRLGNFAWDGLVYDYRKIYPWPPL
jgi:hypothetical protein